MKLTVSNSVVGPDAFADFDRYPADRTEAAPLVIWVGGAIPGETYERRRATEPVAILAEFEAARSLSSDPPCDLLLLSSPPTLQDLETRLDRFHHHLAFELFPLLPLPHPTALGLIGNSFGAHLATGFACRRPDARALATLAGVGLWDAVRQSGGELPAALALRCYANKDDLASGYARKLETELAARGRFLDLVARAGDHPFADYAANGSIREAFEFVLRSVHDEPRTPRFPVSPLISRAGNS